MTEVPSLPPLLTGRPAAAQENAFAVAVADAREGRFAAGDLVWRIDPLVAEIAVVLEPEVPLDKAAAALLVTAVTTGDALAALLPPERPIGFVWPDKVLADGAEIARLQAMCGPLDRDDVPRWLVVGSTTRLAHEGNEPGRTPDRTSLEEEGAGDVGGLRLIESFSRHFVFRMHLWETEGLRPVAEAWTRQAVGPGRFLGFDEHGDAMFAEGVKVQMLRLIDAIGRADA